MRIQTRAAACEGPARTDLRDAKSGPSRGEAAARCGSLPEPQIQHSKFSSGCSLRSARKFGYELRASAGRRLRPARSLRTDPCPSQALRQGAAAGCRSLCDRIYRRSFRQNRRLRAAAVSLKPRIQKSKIKIQNENLNCSIRGSFESTFKFGLQLAKEPHERTCGTRAAGLRGAKLRPAAVPCRNRKFSIQNSARAAACGARLRR